MKIPVSSPTYQSPITDEAYAQGVVALDEQGRDINRLILEALNEQNSLLTTLNDTISDLVDALPGGGRVMRTRTLL